MIPSISDPAEPFLDVEEGTSLVVLPAEGAPRAAPGLLDSLGGAPSAEEIVDRAAAAIAGHP